MNERSQRLKYNTICALLYQVILVITGLILPRLYLYYYGSAVNGVITSVKQFLAFINICDLGISAVVTSAFYKPLAENDILKTSQILCYSKRFFRRIGYIMVGYIILLVIIYPMIVSGEFDYIFVITLIFSMSVAQLAQYFIGISYQIMLNADQRPYIQLIINGGTLILNTILSIIIMVFGGTIQVVYFVSAVVYFLRPVHMMIYVKKNYKLNKNILIPKDVVKQKRNGIIQHISYTIYENTDVLVLTILSTLQNVSIYSIYTMVVGSIKSIINSIFRGFESLFGNIIACDDKKTLTYLYDLYDWCIHSVSTLLYSVTGILIVPFVMLYTGNINDADYYVPTFAMLITITFFLNTVRNAMFVMIRAAGHYKQTQKCSIMEAIINLGVSIMFVIHYGLIGVAVGTLISTTFSYLYLMIYLSKNIVCREKTKFIKQIIVDVIFVFVIFITCSQFNLLCPSTWKWLGNAIIVTVIGSVELILIQGIFYKKNIVILIDKIKSIIGRGN